MRLRLTFLALSGVTAAYFSMVAFAPEYPFIHTKVINTRGKAFIIGASAPSTYCPLDDENQCPPGVSTLINRDMTFLAVREFIQCLLNQPLQMLTTRQSSVPGGQLIYVAPDGSISYPPAHSALHPPGSQMGGFFPYQILSDCSMPLTILSWRSSDGSVGLWACPLSSDVPNYQEAELKASTAHFKGEGCIAVGVQIQDAGGDFGAWAYT